jgi:Na+/proline symporter
VHYFSLDHVVVYIFLLLTLGVGLWAGRGIKNLREYAVANRVYGTGVLTISFLATAIGGSTVMGVPKNVFTDGFIAIICAVAPVICIFWMALLIAPRMLHFEGSLTMGDVMGTLYGKHGQVATGVLGFLTTTCIVSAQITALAYVYEFMLGIKSHWAIGLGGLIAVLYASLGGMKAVTTTDVLQFVVLAIVVPMIANVLAHEVGGIKTLWGSLPAEKLQLMGHPKLGYYTALSLFTCVWSPVFLSPPFVALMLMARDKKQASHMLFMGGTFFVFFICLTLVIGLSAFVLYPTVAPDKILPHVVNELFPVGLRGLCAAGLIAVIMSTADSFLHAAGLSLSHDVIRLLRATQFTEIRWVKYCTFVVGCISIVMTLTTRSIFGMVVYGVSMMGATITVPFVAGVLGLKPDPRSFKIALWVTIPTFIATNVLFRSEIHHWAYPISLIVNVLVFLGAHVLQNKGFMVERRMIHQVVSARLTWPSLAYWLPTPRKLLAYSTRKLAQYGYDATMFALFLSLNYMVPFFMHGYSNPGTYGWTLAIKSISIFLCVGLLLKPYWPTKLLAYFPTYYHLTLLYCLPFVTTFLFLLEAFSIEWVVNVALSILFLIVLVDWTTFLGLSIVGILLAMGLYRLGIGSLSMPMDLDTRYTLTYAIVFSTFIGLLFARRKEQRFNELAIQNQSLAFTDQARQLSMLETFKEKVSLLKIIKRYGIEELAQVAQLVQALRNKEQEVYQTDQAVSPFSTLIEQLEKKIIPMVMGMEKVGQRAIDHLRLEVDTVPIDNLLEAIQAHLRIYGITRRVQFKANTQHKQLFCDLNRIEKVLVDAIIALQSTKEETPILVILSDTQLHYPLASVKKGYTKKVPAISFTITTRATFPATQPYYTAHINSEPLHIPKTPQELTVMTNSRIIKAHYGFTHTAIDKMHGHHCYQYVIPVQLRDVRTVDMDKAYMELGIEPTRTGDTYPGAHAQEQAFLAAVKKRTHANLNTIKTAIEAIKWCHGPVKRVSGEPFYLHSIAVAHIVLDYNQDEATILGALLHDTVEDTFMLLESIETIFGKEVAEIVNAVTHLESSKDTFYKVKLSAHENIWSLLEVKDKRAWYVKLADRLHNMRTVQYKPYEKQKAIAQETLQFFVPLAEQLGLKAAAKELKELCWEIFEKEKE